MDQRGEKEEHNSEDLSDPRCKDDVDAAAEGGLNNREESMDQQRDGGYEEAEETTAGMLKEVEVEVEVVGGSEEEEASAPLLAHPCSLLQLLLRACAGCLGLHGYCSDDNDDPKPVADYDDDDDDVAEPEEAAAAAESPKEEEGDGGGDKTASVSVREVSPLD